MKKCSFLEHKKRNKVMTLGGLTTFNIHHGFTEALVRGMRSGFLNDSDYHHLTQCENLEVLLLYYKFESREII